VSGAKEIWFYHLEAQTLDQALPTLLERTLDRGWTAVVEASSQERVKALDDRLWSYSDDSFLPHGALGDGEPDEHPILLMVGPDNPIAAPIRFVVDGADPVAAFEAAAAPYERLIVMFDGRDEEQTAAAREWWRALKAKGGAVAYWRQNGDGRWEKKA
jgi:DNA polymerase-3 subunit chi